MAVLHVDDKKMNVQRQTETDRIINDYLETGRKDYYDEEIADEPCFQVWYQLSSLRTGLLSWYPFRENAKAATRAGVNQPSSGQGSSPKWEGVVVAIHSF